MPIAYLQPGKYIKETRGYIHPRTNITEPYLLPPKNTINTPPPPPREQKKMLMQP